MDGLERNDLVVGDPVKLLEEATEAVIDGDDPEPLRRFYKELFRMSRPRDKDFDDLK